MSFDVIIVGAGPGGLACAEILASKGFKTLVLERKQRIGEKVCAGGVTWNGLVRKVPAAIFERQFATQHIHTQFQKTIITEPEPIIATVSRERLGRQMFEQALEAGAEIRLGCQVCSIHDQELSFSDKASKLVEHQRFTYLVGADGSSSIVRRCLGLPIHKKGVGINYQIPGMYPDMEWHLNSALFSSGYSWIFPHKETISVGAYVDARAMTAKVLKKNLLAWGAHQGFQLDRHKGKAEFINFDFRGYRFKNIFLVGDAAGLASGLTGEGIYPAIVSGEAAGNIISNPHYAPADLQKLIKNHAYHSRMVSLLGKNKFLATIMSELIAFCLKTKIITFSAAEMAH